MRRLFAVCTLPPWPVRDGYSLRVANVLEHLAGDWDITLLAPGEEAPPGVARHLPLPLRGVGLSYPWRFDDAPVRTAIGRTLQTDRPHRALVWPGAESAWLAAGGDLPAAAAVPAVFDAIDCNPLEFWRDMGAAREWQDRARHAKEAAVAAVHARRAVRGFGATVCVGEADAACMARLGGRTVQVVPNGVALPFELGVEDVRPTMVFAGTLNYPPNTDAVAFAAADIWPRVRAAVPEARWVIAGRRPTLAVRALHGQDGIEVRGDVPDMAAVIGAAAVAIAPMRLGVGLKNKVLEAWACARPVVMTPLATNGLQLPPGHAGLVQAGAAGLAEAVAALLRDGAGRLELGRAARAAVARDFTWRRAAERLDALLRN